MPYVADLHVHSPYSRGTSPQLTFDNLAHWARTKGIDLLATADFTHPRWFEEIRDQLQPCEDGLFERSGCKFILGTEVNCNAEQGGRSRRVHVLVYAPSTDTAQRINAALGTKGSLASDGRPTLHLSARDLLCVLLDIDSRCLVIPAHLWTPWFGLYGSKSGFDSLEECFGDMAGEVHAVETGLSSDPAMNWRFPSLDNVAIVSFSDAHSLPKLGRELTVFPGEPSYDGLRESLMAQRIEYTVEFFPQEGKYHYSGHRKCGVRYSPAEANKNGPSRPQCGRRLTLGVMQRVEELAGRDVATWVDDRGLTRAENGRPPFKTMVSLGQIISEGLGSGPDSKRFRDTYLSLTSEFGSELAVLIEAQSSDIARLAGERLAEGVTRVRAGDISVEPGYDGLYGTVRVWPDAGRAAGRVARPRAAAKA